MITLDNLGYNSYYISMTYDTNTPHPVPTTTKITETEAEISDLISTSEICTHSIARCVKPMMGDITPAEVRRVLETALEHDADGEDMLFYQAQTLDMLFHRLIEAGTKPYKTGYGDTIETPLSMEKVLFALRTQMQCRLALEAKNTISGSKKGNELKDVKK